MIKYYIAKLFGLYTKSDLWEVEQNTIASRRAYYQKVLDELQANGSLPPNCDLVMPKQSLVIISSETGQIIAELGKWKRLPSDGEKLITTYKPK